MVSVLNSKKSRYTQGGKSYYNNAGKVKWWERRELGEAYDDFNFLITPKYANRPDLIAYDVYNNTELSWLVLQFNTIVDVKKELVAGKTIRLPTKNRVFFSIINRKIGGEKS